MGEKKLEKGQERGTILRGRKGGGKGKGRGRNGSCWLLGMGRMVKERERKGEEKEKGRDG